MTSCAATRRRAKALTSTADIASSTITHETNGIDVSELVGRVVTLYALGHHLSVAGAVGFIALAGVAAEFGVVMLIYPRQSIDRHGVERLMEAIDEGAVQRVRPKAMTVAVILGGLAPIMWSQGTGAEIMQRIAASMIGGMITAPLLSMFVIPAAYFLMRRRSNPLKGEAR